MGPARRTEQVLEYLLHRPPIGRTAESGHAVAQEIQLVLATKEEGKQVGDAVARAFDAHPFGAGHGQEEPPDRQIESEG